MDFRLDAHLMALLLTRDCADWLVEYARAGAAPTFNQRDEVVFRFSDAGEGLQFQKRWLSNSL